MDRLTKVWQVWNRTKINRAEFNTHKKVRANRVETVPKNYEKLRATSYMFKVEAFW
jgi:hypothetical protein